MRAYSQDIRRRIIRARERGDSAQEISKRFEIHKRTVERYWRRYRQSGQISAQRMGGYRRSRLEKHDLVLRRWITEQSDLTLIQIQERCRKRLGVSIGINALWHRIDHLGLSYKKNASRRRAKS
jgi:transposase